MPRGNGMLCSVGNMNEVNACNIGSCNKACIDGMWTDWGSWSTCRANKCAEGYTMRHRMEATQPNDCGKAAAGMTEEFNTCYGKGLDPSGNMDLTSGTVCKRDCLFADWQDWTECSMSCFGISMRLRQIKQYAAGIDSKECVGPLRLTVPCNPVKDAAIPLNCGGSWKKKDCTLTTWDPWSRCSEQCDGGTQRRARIILQMPGRTGSMCNNSLAQMQACNKNPCPISTCVDCKWAAWSEWGACSMSGNARYRRRNIAVMGNHCGKRCPQGNATEVSSCMSRPGEQSFCIWQPWADWSPCPVAGDAPDGSFCGPIARSRGRALLHVDKLAAGLNFHDPLNYLAKGGNAAQCLGMQLAQEQCLPYKPCVDLCTPVTCQFNDWAPWGEGNCQGLCNRFRTVKHNAECGAIPCTGHLFETKTCETTCDRPQDCKLGDWEMWGNCMGTSAQTYRARPILLSPHNGGSNTACLKNISETKPCLGKQPSMDCHLTDWSHWTPCTRTCGTGWALRKRHIDSPAIAGGLPCGQNTTGKETRELMNCNVQTCPEDRVDCRWNDWSKWSHCRRDGQRYREREILYNARSTGAACVGAASEIQPCTPKHCRLSDWTGWSACDKPCDGGQRARHRQVASLPQFGGDPCPLPMYTWEIIGCNKDGCHPDKDCQVGEWSMWGDCDVTCGYGQESRNRLVIANRQHRGQGCIDDLDQSRKCMPQPCENSNACHYTQWESWTACSLTCGGGEQTRQRTFLTTGSTIGAGGSPCHADETLRSVQQCNVDSCQSCTKAQWGAWSAWTICPVQCGGAMVNRSRTALTRNNHCTMDLTGPDQEYKECADTPCHGDQSCLLSDWSRWTPCSQPCDGVMRTRRHVLQHAAGRGKPCHGPIEVYAPCNPMPHEAPPAICGRGSPRDCVWSPWTVWEPTGCTKPCGGGLSHRQRHISVPPKDLGRACNGSTLVVNSCNMQVCPGGNDCKYHPWHDWGACDRCGGQRKRSRELNHAGNGGQNCLQDSTEEVQGCSRHCHGAKFCAWADWAPWGTCSATCGNGRMSRTRQLALSDFQPRPGIPPTSSFQQKFTALEHEIGARRDTHKQEIAVAFIGGCMSFLVLASAIRVCTRSRAPSESYAHISDPGLE